MRFTLKSRVSIGQLLTGGSVIASAIAFLISWSQDRALERRQQADLIRQEAARTLSNIESFQKLRLSFFDRAQTFYSQGSIDFLEHRDRLTLRDYLFHSLVVLRGEINSELLEGDLTIPYYGILAFDLSVDSLYVRSMKRVSVLEGGVYKDHISDVHKTVMGLEVDAIKESSHVGNPLRILNENYRDRTEGVLEDNLLEVKLHLKTMIRTPDRLLLN